MVFVEKCFLQQEVIGYIKEKKDIKTNRVNGWLNKHTQPTIIHNNYISAI